MIGAPQPANETERLMLLHHLAILDTPREQKFDNIAQLAMMVCEAPIAVISLIDAQRQWFKSCIGLGGEETERDLAFCAHAILQPDTLMEVRDAHLDPRFADHPFVLGEPRLRFYAGMPLEITPGIALGTLCIIDYVPRQLTPHQRQALMLLANQVVQLLQLHESNQRVKQQSIQLERERKNLDLVIRGANMGTWQWNVQTGEVILNERWASILGFTLAELSPMSIQDWEHMIHPDDLPAARQSLEQHFAEETDFYDSKFRMCHKDGTWVWVYTRGRVLSRTDQGEPLWMFGTHADITELQVYQERLQASEERLQSMIRNFPGAVYRCENNPLWTMHYISPAIERLSGYLPESFMGDGAISLTQITHPEDIARHYYRVQMAVNRREPFDVVYRLLHRDGSWRYVQEVGTGIYDEQGQLQFLDGFIWDITQAEEARNAIQLNEQKLSSLYQLSPVAIALHRLADGAFVEGNPEFYRMLGYTAEEFPGLSYWDITPTEYAAAEMEQLESLHITGRYGPYEKHYLHKDGHQIPVLLNGVLIENSHREKQIWSIIQDITERKRIEQMKNEFVSAVSHELRTPLTSISGSLGLILNGMLGEVPVRARDMLVIAHKNALRLAHLINDLLDMEKLAAGKLDFYMQPQAVLPIVEQSIESMRGYAENYGVSLVFDAVAGDASVNIDAQRLQQVLTNFLSNAVKFSPEGSRVILRMRVQGRELCLAVTDQGPGISDEFRTRIFQKFSQADASSSRQRGGTGLGLAISKELVERMGGNIGFDSIPGEGATFYACFPLLTDGRMQSTVGEGS